MTTKTEYREYIAAPTNMERYNANIQEPKTLCIFNKVNEANIPFAVKEKKKETQAFRINSYLEFKVKLDDAKADSTLAFSLDVPPTGLLLTPPPRLVAGYLCISPYNIGHNAPNTKIAMNGAYSIPLQAKFQAISDHVSLKQIPTEIAKLYLTSIIRLTRHIQLLKCTTLRISKNAVVQFTIQLLIAL